MRPKYVYLSQWEEPIGYTFDGIESAVEFIKDEVMYHEIHPDDVQLFEVGNRVSLDITLSDVKVKVR